jgi:hypothetical protein
VSQACRFAVMLSLLDLALAHEAMDCTDQQALDLTRRQLGIKPDQFEAMRRCIGRLKRFHRPGEDVRALTDAITQATVQLTTGGIPLAAMALSAAVSDGPKPWLQSMLAARGLP